MTTKQKAVFRRAYRKLARVGRCDGYGGMECRRVRREWLSAGAPADVETFIADRANQTPRPPDLYARLLKP
jgi:hypothetical protein